MGVFTGGFYACTQQTNIKIELISGQFYCLVRLAYFFRLPLYEFMMVPQIAIKLNE